MIFWFFRRTLLKVELLILTWKRNSDSNSVQITILLKFIFSSYWRYIHWKLMKTLRIICTCQELRRVWLFNSIVIWTEFESLFLFQGKISSSTFNNVLLKYSHTSTRNRPYEGPKKSEYHILINLKPIYMWLFFATESYHSRAHVISLY